MGNCRHGALLLAATVAFLAMAITLVSGYMHNVSRAKEAARAANSEMVRRAIDAYTTDKGHKPKSLNDLAASIRSFFCLLQQWLAAKSRDFRRKFVTTAAPRDSSMLRARRRFRQPAQIDLLPEKNAAVGGMIAVEPHIVQIWLIRDGHEAGVGRLGIEQREIPIRPVA